MLIRKISSILIISLFFIGISWFVIGNFHIYQNDLDQYMQDKITLPKLNELITNKMKSDSLFHKDEFINLNGLYGRLTKRNNYNGVILLRNGMLTGSSPSISKTDEKAESLVDFSNFVTERGGHYIYVQCPHKIDMNEELLPEGMNRNFIAKLEKMLGKFKHEGVDVIDLQPVFTTNISDFEDTYYSTDIHWKPTAAFKAFGVIMDHLMNLYPEELFPDNVAQLENWTIHEIPNQFLGTWGKRVGLYFAGIDSLQWITPNFETELSIYIPNKSRFLKGNYEKVFLQSKYMEPGGDKLHTGHYDIYIGGGYPITTTLNPSAPSGLKVLILKDSYALPMQTFFPLVFQEVNVIDPRYYTETSIKEYVDRTRPDIVMTIFHAKNIGINEYYIFESEDDIFMSGNSRLLEDKPFTINSSDDNNEYDIFYDNFENERIYTLDINEFKVISGKTDSVSVILYDRKNKKTFAQTTFDVNYCNKFNNCSWTFEMPESNSKNMELRIYAGFIGKTKNVGIEMSKVRLLIDNASNIE